MGESTGGGALLVPTTVRRVATEDQARQLAHRLQRPDRAWPVVVISTPAGRDTPFVDPGRVLDEVSGLAEVVVIPTGDISWEFSRHMPEGTQVYGGASRVYGTGLDWVHVPQRSPLHFAYTSADGTRLQERLVRDALAGALHAGLVGAAEPAPGTRATRGRVLGVLGSRALVQTDDDGQVTIAEELTLPGVPLGRLLAPGMPVSGVLDRAGRVLDVRGMLPDAGRLRQVVRLTYRVGQVVLGRVEAVDDAAVTIALAPWVVVRVHRSEVTGNDLDLLGDLFTVGEVVTARMVPAPLGGVGLRLDDVDERETPVPAIALLDGGPPWLEPPPVTATEEEPADLPGPDGVPSMPAPEAVGVGPPVPTPRAVAAMLAGASPAPAPPAPPSTRGGGKAARYLSLALDAERAKVSALERDLLEVRLAHRQGEVELDGLRAYVAVLQERIARRDQHVEQKKTELRKARTEAATLRRRLGELTGVDDGDERLFLDPEEQFRFEVQATWAHTIRAAEKQHLPLGEYTLGPRFLASLDEVEGVKRERVVWTVVHVVTGNARNVNGLELHHLRTGAGGDDPVRVRDADDAVCYRVSLQVNTPSARRLHFWKVPGGTYELSRVVVHDDTEP